MIRLIWTFVQLCCQTLRNLTWRGSCSKMDCQYLTPRRVRVLCVNWGVSLPIKGKAEHPQQQEWMSRDWCISAVSRNTQVGFDMACYRHVCYTLLCFSQRIIECLEEKSSEPLPIVALISLQNCQCVWSVWKHTHLYTHSQACYFPPKLIPLISSICHDKFVKL